MFVFLLLLFPLVLLALPLLMEQVERPLRSPTPREVTIPPQLGPPSGDLAGAPVGGYAPAVKQYRRLGRLAALRPQRSAVRG